MKGLTTPNRVGCEYLSFCVGTRDLCVVSYWIDTLVLQTWGKYLRYFTASSSPLRGNPMQCSRGSTPPTSTPTPYIRVREEKNRREGFIAFYDTEPPPSPKLSREGWSGVCSGLRRGESVAIVIINHPPSPISWCSPPCVSNSIVGLLDSDELDEIYHVIELVLLGFDP